MERKQKPNSGVIFKSREKKTEAHPDGSGSGLMHCPHCHNEIEFWISSWRNLSKGGEPYSKLSFKAKNDAPKAEAKPDTRTAAQRIEDMADDIPF